jgi:hypothetical protein
LIVLIINARPLGAAVGSTLSQRDTDQALIRKTSLLRDHSNGTRGQAAPALIPRASTPVTHPIRMTQQRRHKGMWSVRTIIDLRRDSLGTISSSRCQTTRTANGRTRSRTNLFSILDEPD